MTKDIDPGALFDEARKLERSGGTRGALQRYHYVATNWPNSIEGAAARLECERVTGRKWADIPPPLTYG